LPSVETIQRLEWIGEPVGYSSAYTTGRSSGEICVVDGVGQSKLVSVVKGGAGNYGVNRKQKEAN
jgi:hypothetical protein